MSENRLEKTIKWCNHCDGYKRYEEIRDRTFDRNELGRTTEEITQIINSRENLIIPDGGAVVNKYFPDITEETYNQDYENNICPFCKNEIIDTGITFDDYRTISFVSRERPLLLAMIELRKTDIVEYELKMAKIREQEQEKWRDTDRRIEAQLPHCPHCHSTDISPISATERAGSILVWGIFSKKINKSFKCKKCGYTW